MKTRFSTLVRCLSVLLLAAMVLVPRAVAQVVNILDPALNAAIRTALGKPTGDITVADMESLTELDVEGGLNAPLIGSLEGLQTARNLTRLDLSGGDYDGHPYRTLGTHDFSPLASLSGLAELDLSRNQLTDVTLLAGLTSLTTLDLSDNWLTNLSVPAGLPNLTTLDLSWWNRLTDFSFLSGLPNLRELDLN